MRRIEAASCDARTILAYADRINEYAELSGSKPEKESLADFLSGIPAGSRIMDLGCGPGFSAAKMRDAGFAVDAMDASPEFAEHARSTYGIDVQIGSFEDLDERDCYAGIWANFSLLHAPKSEMPKLLALIKKALVPGGKLHLGLKLGVGEERDHLGRFYAYYTEAELEALLSEAGLKISSRKCGRGKGLAGTVSDWIVIIAYG